MTYPFRQGIDYGPRSGTRGLSFHMSEGEDNLAIYLSQRAGENRAEWIDRVNGVSCHAALLSNGTVIQMLDWTRACGNLNPADRAGEYGYYGHHHLVDVLGDGWTNPNEWTISMEIAGYRAAGPTAAQVEAAIAWGLDMKRRFPSLRGATGHHDQSPKACPGLTTNMKAIFTGVGGHGLWTEEPMGLVFRITEDVKGLATVNGPGHSLIRIHDGQYVPVPAGQVREVAAKIMLIEPAGTKPAGTTGYLVGNIPGALPDKSIAAMLLTADATFAPTPPNCTAAVAAATKTLTDRITVLTNERDVAQASFADRIKIGRDAAVTLRTIADTID